MQYMQMYIKIWGGIFVSAPNIRKTVLDTS
jgi:hypothetical protein